MIGVGDPPTSRRIICIDGRADTKESSAGARLQALVAESQFGGERGDCVSH